MRCHLWLSSLVVGGTDVQGTEHIGSPAFEGVMIMIWLEKDESIVMNDNCLVSVLSVSVDEVRLCITP